MHIRGSRADHLFPAYAGVILAFFVSFAVFVTFPRIRGGDPAILATPIETPLFSPHTRG